MEEGYGALLSANLPDSVPAVIVDSKGSTSNEVPVSNVHAFPPSNGGYVPPGTPYDGDNQATTSWAGVFNISSYSPYFNVDTDVVFDRLISSMNPLHGDFQRKINTNPDLYGPLWISTTLAFLLSALGNCATYLSLKGSNPDAAWAFDVNYVNWAACVVYGYALAVPAAFFFLLRYFGSNAYLIQLWCFWGYSLFIFVPSSILLVIPSELLRWVVVLLMGSASSWFVATNLKPYTEGGDLTIVVVSAMVLQFALALFVKVFFFA